MLYNISICVTDLANLPDEAVKKASNGKFYLNAALYINDKPNEYGQIGNIVFYGQDETKIYIGSIREVGTNKKNDEADNKSWKEHLAR